MSVSTIVILVSIVVAVIYDLFAYELWGNIGTISVAGFKLGEISPAFIFGVGFVMGHIFWQVHICL